MKYLLLCGVHGDEQCAVLATMSAIRELDKYDVEYMIVNYPGLRKNTREVPEPSEKTKNMNRMYGTSVSFDSDSVISKIKEKISQVDVVIDVHNSPACSNSILVSNNKYAKSYIQFANKMDIRYILRESETDTAKKYAIESGKIGFTVELGGMCFGPGFGNIISGQIEFISNLIVKLEMYCTTSSLFTESLSALSPVYNMLPIHAHTEGILSYTKELGEWVGSGAELATIYNDKNEVVDVIQAPTCGWIADTMGTLYVMPGDYVCDFQPDILIG